MAGDDPAERVLARLRADASAREAARRTWAPHTDPTAVAAGYVPRGTSTLRRPDGSVVLSWEKTKQDEAAAQQAVFDAFELLGDRLPPAPLVKPSRHALDDLLAVYPMGDPHIGMLAWAPETLADSFDLSVATRELERGVDELVAIAPPARTAIVLPLGDFFHSDNDQNRTGRSGHSLDVDGRYAKIVTAGVLTLERIVMRALAKHQHVIVRCEIGNHDDHSSLWLALCMSRRFSENPRVQIVTSPARFWYYRFGRVLIGSHHGHTAKHVSLGEIMAHDQPEAWGATEHRYWYVGHIHTTKVHERPGVEIETFRTAAPLDAYASAAGYRSGRDMRLDILHRQWGRVQRNIMPIRRIQDLIEGTPDE